MSRLVSLNLSDNKITDLPLSMGNCTHLDTVLLERNPIKDKELLRKYEIGTDHLIDYLSKKYFAQNQINKKKQKETAKKAGAQKLREDMKKAAARARGAQDDDEGFEEVDDEEPQEVQMTPEEQRVKMRASSQKLSNDCRNEVITLKRALMKANTMDDIIPIARAVRALIPHMNTAREHMAPVPKPQPPIFSGNETKETQLKKTTAVAIKEFEGVLGGIFNIVSGNASLDQLIPLSGVISGSLEVLQQVTKDLPPQF